MEVKDLQPKQGKVDITLDVVDKGDVREFQKFGTSGKVCSATAKDDTGEVKLSLWNEQIDQVNAGDKVKITNGYVNEFQGELQLTTGKFGQMEVIKGDGGDAPAAEEKPAEEAPSEEAPAPAVEEEKVD